MKRMSQPCLAILTGLVLLFGLTGIVAAKPQPKVHICHLTGAGDFIIINVNKNAEPAHLNHGDASPAEDGSCPNEPPTSACPCWDQEQVAALRPRVPEAEFKCFDPLIWGTSTSYGFREDLGATYTIRLSADFDVNSGLFCWFIDTCTDGYCSGQSYSILNLTAPEHDACRGEAAAVAAVRDPGCVITP